MGKSKALVAGATGISHTTIATDPGLARTEYEFGDGSSSWIATVEPVGELTMMSAN